MPLDEKIASAVVQKLLEREPVMISKLIAQVADELSIRLDDDREPLSARVGDRAPRLDPLVKSTDSPINSNSVDLSQAYELANQTGHQSISQDSGKDHEYEAAVDMQAAYAIEHWLKSKKKRTLSEQQEAALRRDARAIVDHQRKWAAMIPEPAAATRLVATPVANEPSKSPEMSRHPIARVASRGRESILVYPGRRVAESRLAPELTAHLNTQMRRYLGRDLMELREGLTGSSRELAAQAQIVGRSLADEPDSLRAFILLVIVPTLERLEAGRSAPTSLQRAGDAKKLAEHLEGLTDVASGSFQQVPIRHATDNLYDTMVVLRQTLGELPPAEWPLGMWQTQANLAGYLMRTELPHWRRLAVYLYLELLEILAARPPAAKDPLRDAGFRMIQVCANNASNAVDDLRDGDERESSEELLKLRYELTRVATVLGTATLKWPRRAETETVQALTRFFAGPADHPFGARNAKPIKPHSRWAVALDEAMRSPGAWLGSVRQQPFLLAYLEAAAAVVRMAHVERRREAPSCLFNCGVSLLRLSGVERRGEVMIARLVVNLLGLRCALHETETTPEEVFVTRDGLDCAVNFFGAAAGYAEWSDADRRALREFARGMLNIQPELPPRVALEYQRLAASFEELMLDVYEETPGTRSPSLSRLRDLVDLLLGHFSIESARPPEAMAQAAYPMPCPAPIWPGDEPLATLPEMLIWALSTVTESSTATDATDHPFVDPFPILDQVADFCRDIVQEADNPTNAFIQRMASLWSGEAERAAAPQMESSQVATHPAVRAGVASEEEWARMAEACHAPPRMPLSRWFAETELDWI
jgi:hypothetical protein